MPKQTTIFDYCNAVCPQVAEALVRANLPELCTVTVFDMRELMKVMTS